MSDNKFEAMKVQKGQDIDQNTEFLIEKHGFSFDGVDFLLDPMSREKWLALKTLELIISFPVVVSAKVGEYSLKESDLPAFLIAALSVVQSYKNSGRSLRIEVQGSTSWDELRAVMDDRV